MRCQEYDVPACLEPAIALMQRYDNATYQHLLRVGSLASRIAKRLDLPTLTCDTIRWAGLLHDFGKIAIRREILNAPRALTNSEWQLMMLHPESGAAYARTHGEHGLAELILSHHERIDGRGYPWGIAGTKIPLGARVIAVADAYDVLTSGRPYRPALAIDDAFAVILASEGSQFDPDVVEALSQECLVVQIATKRSIASLSGHLHCRAV